MSTDRPCETPASAAVALSKTGSMPRPSSQRAMSARWAGRLGQLALATIPTRVITACTRLSACCEVQKKLLVAFGAGDSRRRQRDAMANPS